MSLRQQFDRLAAAVDHARNVGALGPGTRATLRRAAAELREVPDAIEERDRLRRELATLHNSAGVPYWPPREEGRA